MHHIFYHKLNLIAQNEIADKAN